MMSPEQALSLLDQYLMSVNVNRNAHNQILAALQVLGSVVMKDKMQKQAELSKKKEEPKEEPKAQ